MAPMIHFGVEIEFCLGYILPGTTNPAPVSTRMVDFSVSEDTILEVLETTATRPADGSALESPLTREQLLFPSSSDPSIKGQYTLDEIRGSLVISAVREHIGQALARKDCPLHSSRIPLEL
ncbi:uncharacterized protein PAC_16781 [Phialocephala subalpina]|uniref:Uncharacterized protein n=1 Tax=Phialocephala subalpina TaxID=576137 RepID=A0A1L7XPA0_9HELO|nr:uncharacterized protein PAC_16781 [Phialocephala subalpina]